MNPIINVVLIFAILVSGVFSPAVVLQSYVYAENQSVEPQQSAETPVPTATSSGIESGYPPPGVDPTPTFEPTSTVSITPELIVPTLS